MRRFAIVGQRTKERTLLAETLRRTAESLGLDNIELLQLPDDQALADLMDRMRPDHLDLVLWRIEARDEDAFVVERWSALSALSPRTRLVLASGEATRAHLAFRLAASFVLLPCSIDALRVTLEAPLEEVRSSKELPRLAVRSTAGVTCVPLEDIQFVESSKRGPIVHLPSSRTVITRGTLQTLYEQLSLADANPFGDDARRRFAMAGSSFIVNLDNVRASGKGALIFADGETVIVPVRKRRELNEALEAFRSR